MGTEETINSKTEGGRKKIEITLTTTTRKEREWPLPNYCQSIKNQHLRKRAKVEIRQNSPVISGEPGKWEVSTGS